ncbi:MAG: MBL fold metallo-hydrolase [Myxococcota bacterium]|jgi:beta-lactamase superfamily II metal-dependent hydrolase
MRDQLLAVLSAAAVVLAADARAYAADDVCAPPESMQNGRVTSLHVINVGQGDAVALTCSDGRIGMLVDSGDSRNPEWSKRFKDYMLALAERSPSGRQIGLFVATHSDADHTGGASWVLSTFSVGTFLDNGRPVSSKIYMNLRAKAIGLSGGGKLKYAHAADATAGFDVCPGVTATVVSPAGWFAGGCRNANECSIVLHVKAGGVSFLLTGDAGKTQEAAIRSAGGDVKSSVIKAGHHGSESSTSESFVKAVQPLCAVISSGKPDEGTNSQYKHPRKPVVELLKGAVRLGRQDKTTIEAYNPDVKAFEEITHSRCLYSTASDGTVIFSTDGTALACEAVQ